MRMLTMRPVTVVRLPILRSASSSLMPAASLSRSSGYAEAFSDDSYCGLKGESLSRACIHRPPRIVGCDDTQPATVRATYNRSRGLVSTHVILFPRQTQIEQARSVTPVH